jgi:predicted Zn-dependent protease
MQSRFSIRKFREPIIMNAKVRLTILCLSLCLCAGCAVNPITGEKEFMIMSEEDDVQIGKTYAPEIEKQMGGRIENQALQDYIDRVGQQIVAVSHRRTFDYYFVALNDESVNALALPGGYVFVTKGILEHMTTEAQLAAVLGHEVAHIVARDVANVMSREIGIDILLAVATPRSSSGGVLMARDLTRQIIGLRFSRKDEKEADLAGLNYMVRAGYNPHGMVETMQMLQNLQQTRPVEFFSTHPNPENRIGYLTEEINANYYNPEQLKTAKNEYHANVLTALK